MSASPLSEIATSIYDVPRWRRALTAILVVPPLSVVIRVLALPGRPPLRLDSGIFAYAGWYMARGGSMYTELWEVKLPLPYQTTQLTAYVAGGDPLTHHLLNVALTLLASVAVGLLVADLVYDVVDDATPAVLAGTSVLLLPGYFYLPAFGFKSKFFTMLAGLLALRLARDTSPMWSGAAAAASIGYYQLAAVFPLLVVGIGYQQGGWRGVGRTAVGGVLFTATMLAPIALSGTVEAMLAESIVIPLAVGGGTGRPLTRLIVLGGFHFQFGAIAVAAGAVGCLGSVVWHEVSEGWWIIAGAGWFALVVFLLDYDSFPDLIPGLVFVAIGVGLLYDHLATPRWRRVLAGTVALTVAVNLVLVVGLGGPLGLYTFDPVTPLPELANVTHQSASGFSVERPDVRYLYWNALESDTCHVRLSGTELRWLEVTGKPVVDTDCGSLDLALRTLRR